MDRLIAGFSIALATGMLAILFGMLGGPTAAILVWIFAIIAIASFVAIPWAWYLRCAGVITTALRHASRR
jgi:hypothetical protein